MDLKEVLNSPGMWLASSIMIITVVTQCVLFLRMALKEAKRLNMPADKVAAGMRSAAITAIGPSLSPVIIMMALIAVLGTPTTWMRMNDIGAARTELAMVALAADVYGMDLNSAQFGLKGFSYCLWGMAFNNMGWMFFTLVLTHRMSGVITKMNQKYDPAWIKAMIAGSTIGLFAFLLSPRLYPVKPANYCAAGMSALTMLVISKFCAGNQRLQELALGISMLVGMFTTVAIFG